MLPIDEANDTDVANDRVGMPPEKTLEAPLATEAPLGMSGVAKDWMDETAEKTPVVTGPAASGRELTAGAAEAKVAAAAKPKSASILSLAARGADRKSRTSCKARAGGKQERPREESSQEKWGEVT